MKPTANVGKGPLLPVSRRPSRIARRGRDEGGHGAVAGGERWLISYADLLTLLFALFVVLYAAADHERAQAIADAIAREFSDAKPNDSLVMDRNSGVLPDSQMMVATRDALEKTLAASPALRASTSVNSTRGGFIVSLTDAGFFDPGAADLRAEALPVIDALASSLRGSKAMIRVEGHTDSLPISTARYPSNWELSTARASAVLSVLLARGIESPRLSVAGYAGERPVADNATAEGRSRNRRVDLVVLQ